MPIDAIVVAALPLELTISGHPVRLSVEWEDELRSYPVGTVRAHFTGRSGRPIVHPLGGCCRNPDCVVVSVPADSVAQRIAAGRAKGDRSETPPRSPAPSFKPASQRP